MCTSEGRLKNQGEYKMLKKKLAGLILALTVSNIMSTPMEVFAEEVKNTKTENTAEATLIAGNTSKVTKFSLHEGQYFEEYNKAFKLDSTYIEKISNNGGQYGSSNINKAIDGNFFTHWETGRPNNSSFINEVIIELKETTELNRIVYGARQESAKGKGFAQIFSIYASASESDDDFELVTEGSYNGSTGDIVEIEFKPTEFKRLKFKFIEPNQGWASACEFMLYKQDKLSDEVSRLFTDNTMSEVSPEFANLEKLDELEEKSKNHPLYGEYKERLNLAKEILKGGSKISETVWELESRGNSIREASKRKLWNFQDWQPTGYSVKSGDVINVYVDCEDGEPIPYLVFKQMDRQDNGQVQISLKNGKNTITIPDISTSNTRPGTAAGGVLYTNNPYTEEEQSRKPKIRIENARNYPHYIKGVDNDAEVMKELEEYVVKLKSDSTLPDVFEVFSDKTLVNVRATFALDWYVKNNKLPSYTAYKSDDVIKEAMDFWGFDDSSELNSDFNFRYITMLKYLDGGGFMNAGNGITGINQGSQGSILNVDMGWGLAHEMGHNFDFNSGTIGETTNNMMSLYWETKDGAVSKITEQGLWESRILPKVALDDNTGKEYYPDNDKSLLTHLAPLWQLQLYKEDFWGLFQKAFRENSFNCPTWDDKHNAWVKVSCDILKIDLTEHFERHGMNVSSTIKEYASKYSKPSKKLWYINDKYYTNGGGAFTENLDYGIKSVSMDGNNVKLTFYMNEEDVNNTLGYEIFRDGKVIGFTAEDSFTDKTAEAGENHVYKIVAYDMEINPSGESSVSLYAPQISCQKEITIELGEEFNPLNYVEAKDYLGKSIMDSVNVVSNTVDTSKKGIYEVVYEVESQGSLKNVTSKVEVVSKTDYLSEIKETRASVGWGVFRKNLSPGGKNISLYRDGMKVSFDKGLGTHAKSEVIYNVEDKGYTSFRAYAGIDGEVNVGSGLATFEVYVDGEKVYDSGKVKCGDDYRYVDIDICGARELKLVTTDGDNGITSDNTVWADAKLISNNTKPVLYAQNAQYKLGDSIDLKKDVTADDTEDGDLTAGIKIKSTDFIENKAGNFNVIYEVSDSDNNICEKTINITVYNEFDVKKSYYGQFDNLAEYNIQFKIPVSSVSNNGGNYGSSTINRAIDGSVDSHFETGKPNSDSFKNEVLFTFEKLTAIDKMAYGARRGGKGFATEFEVYISETLDGNDFYKTGEGSYNGSRNDVIELKLDNVQARRIKFVFKKAYDGWASIGEMSFYKKDALADKISNDLFTDDTMESVTSDYNTLEKVNALREEALNHPAYSIFEDILAKADESIKSDFPWIKTPNDISTKLGVKLELDEEYSADDRKDGDLTESVSVEGIEDINYNKAGKYEVTYTVEDSDGNSVSEVRNVYVVDMDDYSYLSNEQWKSTHNTYGRFNKDKSQSGNAIRLNDENGSAATYEKGLGTHSNATVIYDLNEINAQYFTSYIGVDRAMYNTVGSIGFQVYLDGEKVYDSGVMKSKDPQKFVEVDLAGTSELKLVINDGGNGNGSDHGNWADAKLHFANENSFEEVIVNGEELADLIEFADTLDISVTGQSDHIETRWNNFITVREFVREVLENVSSTQEEIDMAVLQLQYVIDELYLNKDSHTVSMEDLSAEASGEGSADEVSSDADDEEVIVNDAVNAEAEHYDKEEADIAEEEVVITEEIEIIEKSETADDESIENIEETETPNK